MSEVICKKTLVLMADDCEENSFFVERAFRESSRFQVVGSVHNGREAIAYLSAQGPYADRQLWPFPDILLLDLKMHRQACFEVLEWLQRRSHPDLKVAVLSGSSIASDMQKVRALGAAAFKPKTSYHEKLVEFVGQLEHLLLASGPKGEVNLAAIQHGRDLQGNPLAG